jgi:hypothetical protein
VAWDGPGLDTYVANDDEVEAPRVLYRGGSGMYGFEGQSAAVLVKDCSGRAGNGVAIVSVLDVGSGLPTRCPVELRSQAARLSDSRLRIPVRCEFGCELKLEVRTTRGQQVAQANKHVRPRRSSVSVPLTEPQRKALSRRSTVQIRVKTQHRDGSSSLITRPLQLRR